MNFVRIREKTKENPLRQRSLLLGIIYSSVGVEKVSVAITKGWFDL